MISLTEVLERYGYVAIALGTFFEGETILVMGGFAAHQGYLNLPGVVLAAFLGSISGDQLAFLAGRRYGARLLSRFPRLRPSVARATALLERRGTPLLVGFRFVYGIRNVVPLAAGMSSIPVARFVVMNVIGATLWSGTVGTAGYVFGRGFTLLLDRAREFEEHALILVLALGFVFAVIHSLARRRRNRTGS